MRFVITTACLLGFFGVSGVASASSETPSISSCGGAIHTEQFCAARWQRAEVRRLRTLAVSRLEAHGILSTRKLRMTKTPQALGREYHFWKRVEQQSRHLPIGPKRFRRWNAWLCIHHYEASWQDSGAPYWGGLQMDHGFMQTYGAEYIRRWGTADNWPPFVQILVAERAYRSRGFTPWPNTARYCGLL